MNGSLVAVAAATALVLAAWSTPNAHLPGAEAAGPPNRIEGKVVTPDGQGVAGMEVEAREAVFGYTRETTVTAADGTYSIDSLDPATYLVLFADPAGWHTAEWYDDSPAESPVDTTPEQHATVLDLLAAGMVLENVDATVTPAGRIDVLVEVDGREQERASVQAYARSDGRLHPTGCFVYHPHPGTSDTIGGLQTGEYLVRVEDYRLLPEFFEGAGGSTHATPVSVMAGQTTTITINADENPARAAGTDRYATAVEASRMTYPAGSVGTVVIATGADFPDAMTSSALAGTVGGPVLLTRSDQLPAAVAEEIERLGASRAYIVGGTRVVSASVAQSLDELPGVDPPTRLEGRTRYATAAAVAREVARLEGSDFGGEAFIARGDTFPDALAVGPHAYSRRTPVLLTRPDQLPAVTADVVEDLGVHDVVVAGGTEAVRAPVISELRALEGSPSVAQLGGDDRYQTSRIISRYAEDHGWVWMGRLGQSSTWSMHDTEQVGFAVGSAFPDALAGSWALGEREGILLLTPATKLPTYTYRYLQEHAMQDFISQGALILGGEGAISDGVLAEISEAIQGPVE